MRYLVLLLSAVVFACGGVEPTNENANTNPNPNPNNNNNAGDAALEIGTGADTFTLLAADDRVAVVSAPQTGGGLGFGQHVDVALRVKNIDPQGVKVHVVLADANETYSDVSVQLNLVKDGDWYWGAGVRAVIDACFELVDQPLTLTIDVEDRAGKTGSATLNVRGPEACPRETG